MKAAVRQASRPPLAGEVLAIVWLRYKLAANRLRSTAGIADVVSGVLLAGFLGLFALGLSALFGSGTHAAVQADDLRNLRVLFHVAFFLCFFFGALFPVLRGIMERGLDLSRLLMFPLSHTRLYALHLASCSVATDHLFYYPSLLAMCLAGALVPGPAALAGAGIVLALVICNVVWAQAIALAFQACLRIRRLRELLSVLVVLLSVGAAGNFVSILFPAARDLSSMKGQLSQAGVLLSFLSLFAVAAVLSPLLVLPALLDRLWLQPLLLGLLLAAQAAVYPFVLRAAARLLEHRREGLLETLRGKE